MSYYSAEEMKKNFEGLPKVSKKVILQRFFNHK